MCLMANTAVRRRRFLLLQAGPRDSSEPWSNTRSISTNHFKMCFVWKMYVELAGKVPLPFGTVSDVAQTRKQKSRGIARCYCNVAIGADARRGPLARKELLPMTIQTRRMIGKLGHIRKSSIAFAHFLPVGGGEFVTGITGELFLRHVSDMRKLRVVNPRLRTAPGRTPARLRVCWAFG